MNKFIKLNEWSIIEEGFHPENNKVSESIFSIGNGYMGQRANFEERYSGNSLQGSYIGGVYYPDKTRVGWWKNGYPEYFAKIINSTNWIGIDIKIEGETFDLNNCTIHEFRRELNMQDGALLRSATASLSNGKKIKIESKRFVSLVEKDLGSIEYAVTPLNFNGIIEFEPYLDGGIINSDSNYDETFWIEIDKKATTKISYLQTQTRKTKFDVCVAMKCTLTEDGNLLNPETSIIENLNYVAYNIKAQAAQGKKLVLHKYVAVESSMHHKSNDLVSIAEKRVSGFFNKGFSTLFKAHSNAWHNKWQESDIKIGADLEAQQAIRYNIFQLYQTYTGDNETLNIGPKGFTGEKYGGVTYWDTEAYCLPFYMRTAKPNVARNLLKYRYNHLQKAQDNAQKLGFNHGAALFPMVTINGEECHNEWEITFEEIHRNGAIAYAIHNYIRYTGDTDYMIEYGLEVLIAISRFWEQRVNWSQSKQKYVLLGVTGPNEYENNVNNNWYTLKLIEWTLRYTIKQIESASTLKDFESIVSKTEFDYKEIDKWEDIISNIYFPTDENLQIFLQQDGFLDKELIPVSKLDTIERPIHEKWSWDRILRSCYIKQADVLQGIYMFEEEFDHNTIKRNFEFYEPLTVHESSLSPCIHSILASKIGMKEKAYEMYLRTARLDLDNINNDTDDGLHITSMGGTWMSIVEGFAGLRIEDDQLSFYPTIPDKWTYFEFIILFRGAKLEIRIEPKIIQIQNHSNVPINLLINNNINLLSPKSETIISLIENETVS
ncbi:MAG: family 65 glycosyl hydrolase domain-containing protein [Cyclobacteriaceae bacterium]|nr:family 65 glycosyl hydrolase domain-containing protein [Cyclobacteriaceae bacterium]